MPAKRARRRIALFACNIGVFIILYYIIECPRACARRADVENMALTTTNGYGNINISDEAVAVMVSRITLDCYGVVELASRRLSDSIMALFNKVPKGKGVKIITMDNRIFVELYVILKDGVNRDAVTESLRSSVEYNVEHMTGMRVKSVDIHVVGVKL